jgi:hypothetical protein
MLIANMAWDVIRTSNVIDHANALARYPPTAIDEQ